MDRRSLTFSAVLAASITLSCTLITALQKGEPPNVSATSTESQQIAQANERPNQSSPDKQGTLPDATKDPNGANKSGDNSKNEHRDGSRWSDPITIVTTLLVAIGAIQAAIYVLMLIANRAWVSLDTLDIEQRADGEYVIAAGLKNSGKTPARIAEANITIRHTTLPQWSESVYSIGPFAPPVVLVANETSRFRHPLTFQETEPLMLGPSANLTFWVFGYIRYRDGITPRTRTYRWIRQYDQGLSGGAIPKFRFRHVTEQGYNDAD